MPVADKIKVSVNLPAADFEYLKRISEERGITVTEALRRAIAMERFVEKAENEGSTLLIEGKDHTVRQLVIR